MTAVALVLLGWMGLSVAGPPARQPVWLKAEVSRLRDRLAEAPGHPGLMIELGATYARAGQTRQAACWLRRALAAGYDPDDHDLGPFKTLAGDPAIDALLRQAESLQTAVRTSEVAWRLAEPDLVPEGIAYDPATGRFFVGSVAKQKILRIEPDGRAVELVESGGDGLWSVLGMKVDARRGALWVCSSAGRRFPGQRGWAGLFKFDPETGRLLAQFVLDSRGGSHFFNDLAVGPDGTVYLTDTDQGEVYRLRPGGRHLERFLVPRQFREPNGIAVSADGRRLFVADESAGVTIVDLGARVCRPLGRASSMNLAGIDGLYVSGGALVAVQNAAGTERILRLDLSNDQENVTRLTVLESRNPLFAVPTTGAMVDGWFYYIANSHVDQLDATGRLAPGRSLDAPVVLRTPVHRVGSGLALQRFSRSDPVGAGARTAPTVPHAKNTAMQDLTPHLVTRARRGGAGRRALRP